ncbi:putative 37S ribosomal protein S18, mitochondrial [Mycena venus]|uniref:Putative 37S ribosomal protein S18, mitochondrial n=1 Tax=Mycena venus TaxID=2733690 RepID=A0A8H6Y5G9_9AGAR|nr:putative 37S ribosomal protein S18, mitochondrial [Mycena venus]
MHSDRASPPTGFLPTQKLPWDYDFKEDRTKTAPAYRFHCHSTKTNTINTFTDPDGNVLAWFSGGSCGFKKRNRSSYEAGYQCAVRMFEKIEAKAAEHENTAPDDSTARLRVDLFCKGFGQGRDALFKALMTAQGDVVRNRITSITDRTPIKIGGTRSRKRKRR